MKLHWEWEFDVPRETLWPYISDSDWINAHAGLPKIGTRTVALPRGGTRKLAWFREGPIYVEWEERPTLWRAPEFYEVDRIYTRGPLRRFVNRTALETIDERRSRVVVDIDMQARGPLWRAALPAIAERGRRGAARAFTEAAERARGYIERHAREHIGRFDVLRERNVPVQAIAVLHRYLQEGDARDFTRIKPYDVADRYGSERRDVLSAYLTATREGYFDLQWDVLCPSCRGPSNTFTSLSAIKPQMHCDSCNIEYGPDFDRNVEVTFNARPLGFDADAPLYCIASPARSAHVIAQMLVAPGNEGRFSADVPAGEYEINAVGIGMAKLSVRPQGAEEGHVRIEPGSLRVEGELRAGAASVVVANAAEREVIVRFEQAGWPDTIVTAADVNAFDEFHDLFSSEVLAPGLELAVRSLSVLFTDIVGSTAMYGAIGDAPAFRVVTDHFAIIGEIIESNGGTIVKTIGDAVMAVFVDPVRALRAALALDPAVSRITVGGEPLRLRVGFHVGPCIAMRANERNDYFGATVNLAARLESMGGAGDVTFPRSLTERTDARELLARYPDQHLEQVLPKGFSQPVEVVRVCVRDEREVHEIRSP